MERSIGYIPQFGSLNPQQIDLVIKKTKELEISKDGYFSEAGKIARQVGFIVEGVVRVCHYNNKGGEITKNYG
jgi:CRP-like cAMP-binding protein